LLDVVYARIGLPVGSQGRPDDLCFTMDGKQYLLLTVGGARQSPERGDYVIAHALRSR
jgi:quinate dehydrogenase (quinone)